MLIATLGYRNSSGPMSRGLSSASLRKERSRRVGTNFVRVILSRPQYCLTPVAGTEDATQCAALDASVEAKICHARRLFATSDKVT